MESLAWYKHVHLMPWVVESSPSAIKQKLAKSFPAPCLPEDGRRFKELATELHLNPTAKVVPTAPEHCVKGTPVTLVEILSGAFADEPDHGMDRDLPATDDPTSDAEWMGGKGTQAYRHNYWSGWKWSSPLATFQIPSRPMGLARDRVETLAQKARQMIRAGDLVWGTRVLAWALHYLQDLSQPFHAVEAPSLRMVPWTEFFGWPLGAGTARLKDGMNHSVTNYHWAYEGYVLNRLELGKESPFKTCLLSPRESSPFEYPRGGRPFELADAMARVSVKLAPKVGRGNIKFFGTKLKSREASVPKNLHVPNYNEIAVRPELGEEREVLESATCEALSNAAWASHRLMEWAFEEKN